MKKGQTQIISVVLILGLAMGTVATVLPWASSMIQKKKDARNVDNAYNFFISLDKAIKNVAENGGEQTLSIDVPGKTDVSPSSNDITFMFESKISNIALGDWIPLNTPNNDSVATLGIDTPSVIFGKAEKTDSSLLIQYKLWYRELEDKSSSPPVRGYKISIKTTDGLEKISTSGFLRIQLSGTHNEISGAKTITITDVNIIV